MRSPNCCSLCGRHGHNATTCTGSGGIPTTHTCSGQHLHRCVHCGAVAVCCSPECRSLLEGYCVGFCGGGPLLNMRSLGRSEHSALAGPA